MCEYLGVFASRPILRRTQILEKPQRMKRLKHPIRLTVAARHRGGGGVRLAGASEVAEPCKTELQ